MSDEKRVTRSQTEAERKGEAEDDAEARSQNEKVLVQGDLGEQIAMLMQTQLAEHDAKTQGAFDERIHSLQQQVQSIADFVTDSGHQGGQNETRDSASGADAGGHEVSHCGKGRRIPQSFDGGSSWRAYFIQFKLIAKQNGWSDAEKAMQLAASLKGPALDLLGHLPEAQCQDFERLAEALNQRFGVEHQEEAFRVQFRTRSRRPQEPLAVLAQDVERLAYLAYPSVPAEFRGILIRDQFIDALDDAELKIAIRQNRPLTPKDALACALEMESIRRSLNPAFAGVLRHPRLAGGGGGALNAPTS